MQIIMNLLRKLVTLAAAVMAAPDYNTELTTNGVDTIRTSADLRFPFTTKTASNGDVFTVRGRPDDKLAITISFDSSAGVPYFTGITDKVYNNARD